MKEVLRPDDVLVADLMFGKLVQAICPTGNKIVFMNAVGTFAYRPLPMYNLDLCRNGYGKGLSEIGFRIKHFRLQANGLVPHPSFPYLV